MINLDKKMDQWIYLRSVKRITLRMKEEYYFRIENFNDLFDIIEKKKPQNSKKYFARSITAIFSNYSTASIQVH